jgi:hypothetical protein
MEEGDLRDGGIEDASARLESKFKGKVRAIVVERSELARMACSRFPLGDLLWALNSGDMRLRVPRRWKVLILGGGLLASLRAIS